MKTHRISALVALVLILWLSVAPAFGANKEMVQLQTQVQQLQEQMTAMQRGFDERMGVMKNLVEKDTDAVNKLAGALNTLQTTLQKQQGDEGSKSEQLSGQIQALNDTMDEIKVRLAKVTKQLEDMQAAQQSLAAQQATQQAQQAGQMAEKNAQAVSNQVSNSAGQAASQIGQAAGQAFSQVGNSAGQAVKGLQNSLGGLGR